MKLLTTTIIALLFISCASENEQKTLDTIADHFEGNASYSKDIETTKDNSVTKRFTVKLTDSKLLDTLPVSVTSGAIALMTYKGFSQEEKENYDAINVEVNTRTNDTSTFFFDKKLLNVLEKKEKTFAAFSKAVSKKDLSTLKAIRDTTSLTPINLQQLINAVEDMEAEYGAIRHHKLVGIAASEDELGKITQYQGILYFKNKNLLYVCSLNETEDKDQMIGYRIFND